MTNSLGDFPMPYAIQYEASSVGNNFVIPAAQRNWGDGLGDAQIQYDMKPGVYSIIATYDGQEEIEVQAYRKYMNSDGTEVFGWRTFGWIPAGLDSVVRRSGVLTLSIPPQAAVPGSYTRVRCRVSGGGEVRPMSAERGRIVTLQVIPAETSSV